MKIAADNIKDFGTTEAILCPRCGKNVFMQLLKATNGVGVFLLSTLICLLSAPNVVLCLL